MKYVKRRKNMKNFCTNLTLFLLLCMIPNSFGWVNIPTKATIRHIFGSFLEDIELTDSGKNGKYPLEKSVEEHFGVLGLQSTLQYLASTTTTTTTSNSIRIAFERRLNENTALSKKYLDSLLWSKYVLNQPRKLLKSPFVTSLDQRSPVIDVINLTADKSNRLLIMKLIDSKRRWEKEISNMQILRGGISNLDSPSNFFVRYIESYSDVSWAGSQRKNNHVIIMERGEMDLSSLLTKYPSFFQYESLKQQPGTKAPIMSDRKMVKELFLQMARIVQTFHSKKLVWTDLKLSNFVLLSKDSTSLLVQSLANYISPASKTVSSKSDSNRYNQENNDLDALFLRTTNTNSWKIKAIDVESAVFISSPLLDFSPSALPPEHAAQLAAAISTLSRKSGNDFQINIDTPIFATTAQDVWALGIAFLSLLSGKPVVSTTNLAVAVNQVINYDTTIFPVLQTLSDENMRSLLMDMLAVEPSKRPPIWQVIARLQFLI